MCDAIEQGCGHFGVAEHADPFGSRFRAIYSPPKIPVAASHHDHLSHPVR